MDTDELRDKVLSKFNWSTLLENLPGIMAVAGGVLILDKLIDLGTKLAPVYKKVQNWNKDGVFEIIDTVGDNIQLVDLVLKAFKIDLGSDQLDKLADGLQGLATAGKHLSRLYELIAPSLRRSGSGGSQKKLGHYREQ